MRILLVATTLRSLQGFETHFEADEDEALLALSHSHFHAVVGNADKYPRFPTRMRDNHIETPLVMLTLSTNPYMRIRMIQTGANVCLSHPAYEAELSAYLHSLIGIRRKVEGEVLVAEDVEYNFERKTLRVKGELVTLRPQEVEVFDILVKNKGRLVKRDLLHQNLSNKRGAEVSARRVKVVVCSLRKAIRDAGVKDLIQKKGERYSFLGYYIGEVS